METELTFEEYLTNKKINSDSFRQAEPDLWASLKAEFAQMHPNSFTVQKLNLINPIRRKYLLPGSAEEKKSPESTGTVTSKPAIKPGKPVIRPKLS